MVYYVFSGSYQDVYLSTGYDKRFKCAHSHLNLGLNEYNLIMKRDIDDRGRFLGDCRFANQDAMIKFITSTAHLTESKFYGYVQGDFDGRIFTCGYKYSDVYSIRAGYKSEEFELTYIDDQQAVCAFSVVCQRDDSDQDVPEEQRLWRYASAIIRNCNAHPDERKVFYVTDEMLLAVHELDWNTQSIIPRFDLVHPTAQISEHELSQEIQAKTDSKRLNQLISTIFESDLPPHQVISDLSSRMHHHTLDDFYKKDQEFKAIIADRRKHYNDLPELLDLIVLLEQESQHNIHFYQGDDVIQRITNRIDSVVLDARLKRIKLTIDDAQYNAAFRAYGREITSLVEVDILPSNIMSLKLLGEVMDVMNQTIINPTRENQEKCLRLADQIPLNPHQGIRLRNLLIGLVEAAIVLATLCIAVLTFGTLAPISIAGILVAKHLMGVSASIFAAATTAGVGVVSLGIFAEKEQNPFEKCYTNLQTVATESAKQPAPISSHPI